MWLHCLNLQAYWPMAHGNSLKCKVFVMNTKKHGFNKWLHRGTYTTIKERQRFVTLHWSRSLVSFHACTVEAVRRCCNSFFIRSYEKGWLEHQLNVCSKRLQQQNVAWTIMITWRPEFQNVQGLPWQEYDVMSLGMQAALIRPNCVLFLILPFDIVISRFHLSFLLWKPMHGLKISSANITAWEKKQDITTWVLGGRFMGGWGCKLFESVSDIALSRKKHKLLLNGCQKIMIQHVEKMVTVAWFSMWANHGNSDLVSFGT